MTRLVLLRHGQSIWNREDRFTGWVDVDLTEEGIAEATRAGDSLRAAGFDFDVAYTSVLKRAVRTLWITLDRMDRMWLPVIRDWRLNERHYGGLTGLNKQETRERHGEAQVHLWRRSFDVPPPALARDDPRWLEQSRDRRYVGVPGGVPQIPALIDRGKQTMGRLFEKLDRQLADNRFLAGAAFSIADITAFVAIDFAKRADIEIPPACPNVARWFSEIVARPSAAA